VSRTPATGQCPQFEIPPKERQERQFYSGSRLLCAQRQTLVHGLRYSRPDPGRT